MWEPRTGRFIAPRNGRSGVRKALAVELGPQRIRVNTICPTFIETPMTKGFFEDPQFRDAVLSKIKLGRLGTVEDVVGAAVYLASDASGLNEFCYLRLLNLNVTLNLLIHQIQKVVLHKMRLVLMY